MGADTILSMTIIAWAFLPVNRNAVPVFAEITPFLCQFVKRNNRIDKREF